MGIFGVGQRTVVYSGQDLMQLFRGEEWLKYPFKDIKDHLGPGMDDDDGILSNLFLK